MAIWQVYSNIIPKSNYRNENEQENLISWKNKKIKEKKINFLQKKDSWSKNIIQYGECDKTCIEYIYDNNELVEIVCRFDLRSITKDLLMDIINYVHNNDACFLIDGKVYFPEIKEISEAIQTNKAFSFCENPLGFLDKISQTK